MVHIIKSNGEKEEFDSEKIKKSLRFSGLSDEEAKVIAKRVEDEVSENMHTKNVLRLVLKNLEGKKGVYERYDLKRAVMQLGPTGFPFENYFALILENYGYKVSLRNHLRGEKISHEVDVIAEKEKRYMIECKYRNDVGNSIKIKIPLYVYARFLDLKNYFDFCWLATNTKCTKDTKRYAKGVNMRITSWDYPSDLSLRKLIEKKKLYPITILKNVSNKAKQRLFDSEIFLIKTLVEKDFIELKKKTRLSKDFLQRLILEAKEVLSLV